MHGSCLCGAVEFEILGPLAKLYQCHCSLCRKQGGSASNTATVVRAENLRWLAGEELISSWVKESGFRSNFCSRCGSPLPNPLREKPFFWVPVGLLDEGPQPLEIVAQLYVGSKASWDDRVGPGVPFETMPAEDEFLALLHGVGGVSKVKG